MKSMSYSRKTVQPKNETCTKRKQLCQELYQYCLTPNDKFKFETTFIKIHQLINQINEEEKNIPFCGQQKRSDTDFKNFIIFLNESKCKLNDCLTISQNQKFNDDFTVISNKSYSKGDLIFTVSKELILTSKNVTNTHLENLISQDKMLSSMSNVTLALIVLYIKQNSTKQDQLSKWTSYMNILPHQFHTPLYFTLDEIKMLKFSHSFNEILYHIRNITRLYAYIHNLLESKKELKYFFDNFSYENFRWAVSVVSTRQNQIYDEHKKPCLAMIPLLDMCNHEDGKFCTDFDDETQNALCYSKKDINVGDEITIFYGARSNLEMLIHNGFVCESNKYDKVKLKFGLNAHDVLYDKRVSVLEKFGLNGTEYFEISNNTEKYVEILPRLFVFVKIFTAKTQDELLEIQKDESVSTVDNFFTSKDLKNDKIIHQFVVQRLTILIKSIGSSLNVSPVSTNSVFIHRLLSSEINLMQSFVNFLGI